MTVLAWIGYGLAGWVVFSVLLGPLLGQWLKRNGARYPLPEDGDPR